METFSIAAFRSRQSVFSFENNLKRRGLNPKIISTPHAVAVGCGLSIRFSDEEYPRVLAAYEANPVPNLVGFYRVSREGTRTKVMPLNQYR